MAIELSPHKIGGQTFYLQPSITPNSIVGKGSYGVVISATDTSSNKKVAIKRIKPYAGDEWEARHTLREIQLMRLLDVHPNIISLSNLWTRDDDSELYITMELMDSDLHQIIQSKQNLSEPHHQCLMKQLLLGVQAMHKCGVLHRDLKPGNLLVTRNCQLRITDFGLARAWKQGSAPATQVEEGQVGVMTEYVVTRWYRCPELLLAPHIPYTGAIDLWSVGCIFGELLTRRPLFPGKSYVHQVQVILDVLGTPASEAEFGFKPRDDASSFLKRQRHRPGISWQQLVPSASENGRDFLSRLLTWDPNKRLTVDQALGHRWMENSPALPVSEIPLADLLKHKEAQGITLDFEDPATPLPALKQQIETEIAIYQQRALTGSATVSAAVRGSPGPQEASPPSQAQAQDAAAAAAVASRRGGGSGVGKGGAAAAASMYNSQSQNNMNSSNVAHTAHHGNIRGGANASSAGGENGANSSGSGSGGSRMQSSRAMVLGKSSRNIPRTGVGGKPRSGNSAEQLPPRGAAAASMRQEMERVASRGRMRPQDLPSIRAQGGVMPRAGSGSLLSNSARGSANSGMTMADAIRNEARSARGPNPQPLAHYQRAGSGSDSRSMVRAGSRGRLALSFVLALHRTTLYHHHHEWYDHQAPPSRAINGALARKGRPLQKGSTRQQSGELLYYGHI
eukprot:CAMPEP_0182555856 /NCGR_PEP_ID=MMETSP1324-20130603/308_1 /TAXON_ID=236786 /ORGANISM="Florenciella sp., Strain RCC1587" /LENGTH=678 /DNA_ID=CAMNT_0024767641 /DNA_START=121 /DNA_END=2159 /DNA_ORIENTATION=+